MSDDSSQDQGLSPYEQLEHAIWAYLVCVCDCCGRCDEYPPRDDGEEPTDWAKIVAPLAQADGWTAPGFCFLLCPDCRAKGVDWQKLYTPPPCGGISSADREWFQRWLDSDPDRQHHHAWTIMKKSSFTKFIVFIGLVAMGLTIAAARIYIGETDDAH